MSKISADSISSRSGGNIIVNNGVNVTGVITATSFVGNGSGLTGVSAGIATARAYTFSILFGA